MSPSTHELLLALRAPNSGWLATLICALDEALRDPDFDPHQRGLLRALLDAATIPGAVAEAAEERLRRFEERIAATQTELLHEIASIPPSPRPRLTLVVNDAAA
jgi:hypothetical protein